MKKILFISCLTFVIACSPDKELIKENELLKAQIEELKQNAVDEAAKARRAEADALEQKVIAEEVVKASQAEANRQVAKAEEARRRADKLAKQLEACQ